VNLKGAEFAELSAEILSRGGSLRFKAHGCSMFPFIRDGDVLTVQPVEAASLKVGEVALYRANGKRLAAHRVVGRCVQDGRVVLRIRGDAATGPDERVQVEQVLGRVVSVQRREKVVRLDQGIQRLAALLWVRLSPLGHWFLRRAYMVRGTARWLLRPIQGLKPYRQGKPPRLRAQQSSRQSLSQDRLSHDLRPGAIYTRKCAGSCGEDPIGGDP